MALYFCRWALYHPCVLATTFPCMSYMMLAPVCGALVPGLSRSVGPRGQFLRWRYCRHLSLSDRMALTIYGSWQPFPRCSCSHHIFSEMILYSCMWALHHPWVLAANMALKFAVFPYLTELWYCVSVGWPWTIHKCAQFP
jgi:hypothetical protein